MKLDFVIQQTFEKGAYPDVIDLYNNESQLLYIGNDGLYGGTTTTQYGSWINKTFEEPVKLLTGSTFSNLEMNKLGGFGVIGVIKQGNSHNLLIYEFQEDISEYLNSGTISHSIDNPVSRFNLTLENPDIKNPEKPGNIAISEDGSLLSPGAKVIFRFGAGDSEQLDMGQFFIDRNNFSLDSETASTEGRNTIGKVLDDQTVDEFNEYWYATLTQSIKRLLSNSDLKPYNYIVDDTTEEGWFSFTPNTKFSKALYTMLETLPQWKVRELSDGTIVVGDGGYSAFDVPKAYTFYRNKDIFSRQIVRDDAEAYTRVCIHTENYSNVIFKNVVAYSGWNLKANKTLYVQVANGLKTSDLQTYADELAERLSDAGKVESFTGPIRPHLQCEDEAIIIDSKGSKSLGIITEVAHRFGKSGFYTDFTVDSGGTIGRGRLSDYINKIAAGSSGQKAEMGWNDINMNEYINLSRRANVTTSSDGYRYWPKENVIDGKNSYWEWDAQYISYWKTESFWEASSGDVNPRVEIKLGQRSFVNKVKLYFGSKVDTEDPTVSDLPKGYKLQFWNNSFWVDLATVTHVTSGIGVGYIADPEPVHEFDAVETSSIRVLITPTNVDSNYISGHIREIEVWGNM